MPQMTKMDELRSERDLWMEACEECKSQLAACKAEMESLRRFHERIKKQIQLSPEFSKVIDKHFWDLI